MAGSGENRIQTMLTRNGGSELQSEASSGRALTHRVDATDITDLLQGQLQYLSPHLVLTTTAGQRHYFNFIAWKTVWKG